MVGWMRRRANASTPTPMPDRRFAPGFRISVFDALILLTGGVGAFLAASHAWWAGVIIGFVVGHFFLFCNVFRIARRPELIWAAAFTFLAACTFLTGLPGWIGTVACSLLLSVVLIVREMRKPYYHGVGWSSLNPGLRAWWEANG